MKKKILIITALVLVAVAAAFLIFGNGDPHKKDLILYLPFDEGKGITVTDKSGILHNLL